MKKLLLVVVLTIGYGSIQAVPSLSDLKNEYFKSHSDGAADKYLMINFLAHNIDHYVSGKDFLLDGRKGGLPIKPVKEEVLITWYNEDPALFRITYDMSNQEINITDYFLMRSNLKKYLPADSMQDEAFQQDKQIADILQKLGIKPTLSSEELDEALGLAQREF